MARLGSILCIGRRTTATLIAGVLALGGLAAASPAASAAPSHSSRSSVVDVPVSFTVHNVNRSDVPCASDGKTYIERGHLVAPAAALRKGHGPDQITLYLHGLSFGQFFWDFSSVQGYDYARNQAKAGQTSLILDRLGYGSSDKPVGTGICVGSRADIAHQEVQALRSGKYTFDGSTKGAPTFGKVDVAGHSYGGQIAQVEAHSFGDIDGLIVISYSDVVQSALLKSNAAYAAMVCASGGVPVAKGGPGGYASFGPPAGAAGALFHDVAPAVEKATLPKLTLDPCGDTASFPAAVKADLADVAHITVPVLIIGGGSDALFPPPALTQQAALYTGSRDITIRTVADTAHAITLEKTHHLFDRDVRLWLTQH